MTDRHYFQGLYDTALDFTMKAYYADRLARFSETSETPEPFSGRLEAADCVCGDYDCRLL